jgi:hypothetical protein
MGTSAGALAAALDEARRPRAGTLSCGRRPVKDLGRTGSRRLEVRRLIRRRGIGHRPAASARVPGNSGRHSCSRQKVYRFWVG